MRHLLQMDNGLRIDIPTVPGLQQSRSPEPLMVKVNLKGEEKSPAPPKLPGIRLFEAPASAERDRLLGEWFSFIADLDAFLARDRRNAFDQVVDDAVQSLTADSSAGGQLQELLEKMVDRLKQKEPATTRSAGELSFGEIITAINKAPVSDERNLLVAQFGNLAARLDAFFGARTAQSRQELETRRTALYAACRAEEDAVKERVAEIGRYQAWIQATDRRIEEISTKLSAVRPADTRFPTDRERSDYESARTPLVEQLSRERAARTDLEAQLATVRAEAQAAQDRLNQDISALNSVTSELQTIKKEN